MTRAEVWLCVASILMTGQAATPTAGRISGVVRDGASRVPIGGVVVTAISPRVGSVGSAITGPDGRFTILDLQFGSFLLAVSKRGFVDATYGSSRPGEPGIPLTISTEQPSAAVDMPIVRGGVVFGEIRDTLGESERGAEVTLLRVARLGEGEVGEPIGTVRSDDRGRYRFFGVPPGSVVFAVTRKAQSAGGVAMMSDDEIDQRLMWLRQGYRVPQLTASPSSEPSRTNAQPVPVYFPGGSVTGPSGVLAVEPGSEQQLDMVLPEAVGASVFGTVVGLSPGGVASVTLEPLGSLRIAGSGGTGRRALSVSTSADGGFVFRGVSPGSYSVSARTTEVASSGDTDASRLLWASDQIGVLEGQELSMVLSLAPAATVTGRVIVAPRMVGLEGPPDIEIQLMSETVTSAPWSLQRARVDQDGRFGFRNLPPGGYRVAVEFLADDRTVWVAESVHCGSVDALDVPCDLPQTEEMLVSVTDMRSGITGVLDAGEGLLPTDLEVIAFSVTESDWRVGGRRLKMVRPDADGHFECELPAGTYYVGVVTPLSSAAVTSEMLRWLALSSVRVAVPRGELVYQGLRVAR